MTGHGEDPAPMYDGQARNEDVERRRSRVDVNEQNDGVPSDNASWRVIILRGETRSTELIQRSENVQAFLSRSYPEALGAGHRVSLVFQGRLLNPLKTASENGLSDGCVLHCVISPVPVSRAGLQAGQSTTSSSRLDPIGGGILSLLDGSQLLLLLSGILLFLLWLALVRHFSQFSIGSVFMLMGLTFIHLYFIAMHFSSHFVRAWLQRERGAQGHRAE